MAIKPTKRLLHVFAEGRSALGMPQREFGPALGVSHRTASRWDCARSSPGEASIRRLAILLAPVDPALATEAAAHIGETLEALGVAAPRPALDVAAAFGPPAATEIAPSTHPKVSARDLVEIVVCAAAEAADVSPREVRPWLLVAFKRAAALGLGAGEIAGALEDVDAGTTGAPRVSL